MGIDPTSGTFYGIGGTGYRQFGLIRSVGGKTWETVFVTPSTEAEVARLSFRPGRLAHQALTVGWNLYRSFDGGASWSWRALPFRPGAVALDADPNRLIAISGFYAYLSEDAGRNLADDLVQPVLRRGLGPQRSRHAVRDRMRRHAQRG